MIVFTFVNANSISNMWGIFAAGCAFVVLGLIGFVTGWTLRPAIAGFFFWTSLILWGAAIAALIVNAALLRGYMNDQCGGFNASLNCQNIRQ